MSNMSSDNKLNNDIISKITKLRELSKSSNIHEATAAAVAADKLIAKFRITEQELFNHSKDAVEKDTNYIYESARSITWKHSLAMILAKHYSCFIYNEIGTTQNGRKLTRLRLAGVKSDIQISKYMFTWLVFEIERLNKNNKGLGHIFCNSFCLGAVEGIQNQLAESKQESKKTAIANGQETAIQKLDQRYNDAEALINSLTELKTVNKSTKNRINSHAYEDGVVAGSNIHLGKVINGVGIKLLKS